MEIALFAALILAVLALTTGMLALVVVLLREIKKPQDALRQTYTSTGPAVQPETEAVQASKVVRLDEAEVPAPTKAEAIKPLPVAYCGHCGTGIYRDAVEATDVGSLAVMTHECPQCNRKTLLPE